MKAILPFLLLLAACSPSAGRPIIADVLNIEGMPIGTVSLFEERGGLALYMTVKGLSPGVHALHIHETALCETPDFTSAGSHYDPFKKEHGFENPKGHHAGDLPNFEVGTSGGAHVELKLQNLYLSQVDGHSLVIHADEDDYKTDPSGNSGARVACAVLRQRQ
jgi:Cu-Zn family superoxide dismutase